MSLSAHYKKENKPKQNDVKKGNSKLSGKNSSKSGVNLQLALPDFSIRIKQIKHQFFKNFSCGWTRYVKPFITSLCVASIIEHDSKIFGKAGSSSSRITWANHTWKCQFSQRRGKGVIVLRYFFTEILNISAMLANLTKW